MRLSLLGLFLLTSGVILIPSETPLIAQSRMRSQRLETPLIAQTLPPLPLNFEENQSSKSPKIGGFRGLYKSKSPRIGGFRGQWIAQTVEDRQAEADRLFEQGIEQYQKSQYREALQSWENALKIYREIGDRQGEAISLGNLGVAYYSLGQYQKAIEYYQQILVIFREIKDRQGEANALGNLGLAYDSLGQYQKAIEYYEQILVIFREIGDRQGEAATLGNLGNAYYALGEYQKAIEYHQQSLAIDREIGNRQGEAISLGNLGIAYRSLGQYQKAIEYHQQHLAIAREIGDRQGEANSLGSLGIAYYSLGQYQKAIEYQQQSLAIAREIGDRQGETISLGNLGVAYYSLGQYQKAIEYQQQSLAIAREIGNRQGEAASLGNLGSAYYSLGEYQKAIEYYQQSLVIAREIGDRYVEEQFLEGIGNALAAQNQPELAIIFYKQSVNVTESIREDIKGLPQDLQQSYLNTVADTYRRLADLLLQQDRVLEAQRVLDLLKVQELDDYLRGVRGNNDTQQGIYNLSPEEEFITRYGKKLEELIKLGQELTAIRKIPPEQRTTAQEKRRIELETQERQLIEEFNTFYRTPEIVAIVQQLKNTPESEELDPKTLKTLQDELQQISADAVLIYPLILEDRLELVLVTAYTPPIRKTVYLNRTELNKTIVEFRAALQNPKIDPKPSAKKLYDALILPLKPALDQVKAKTIIYAPDSQLRYIPLGALYDGKQWLVENYRINYITALSLTNWDEKSSSSLTILAGAFTTGSHKVEAGNRTYDFNGLPYAGKEVDNLTKTIAGTVTLLDEKFSLKTFLEQMTNYSLIHLATHAAFVPGQPEDSFILFGDGSKATFADVESWKFYNTDLVVLSACETGLGGKIGTSDDGREILGFGYLMQQANAKAAIASLWSVSDGGTQALMDAFYNALQQKDITKAEALRQAQIFLITGKSEALGGDRGLGVRQRIEENLPTQVSGNLSHPYYWGAFILIGNGL